MSAVSQLPLESASAPVFWVAFGPPCVSVHFPLLMNGDVPAALCGQPALVGTQMRQLAIYMETNPQRWLRVRQSMGRLQARFEQDLKEFQEEAVLLAQPSRQTERWKLAGSLMQRHVELFEECVHSILGDSQPAPTQEVALSGMADF